MIARIYLFPLGALLVALLAYRYPEPFEALSPAIVPLLGLIMLGMGITLRPADFARVMEKPSAIVLGTTLQFSLMSLIAWLIAGLLGLTTYLVIGMVLVGSCPGGTASNIVCFIAQGDVPLSITLTTVSTLLSMIITPLLTWIYVGQLVPVPVLKMFLSILAIVLMPVVLGVSINHFWGSRIRRLQTLFPLISIMAVISIIAIVVAINREEIGQLGLTLITAVILHNLLGLTSGYWVTRLFGFNTQICRTIAIEVGMQNSGLGVTLAHQFFSAMVALPGVLFSIWHNLSGALIASHWARLVYSKPRSSPPVC